MSIPLSRQPTLFRSVFCRIMGWEQSYSLIAYFPLLFNNLPYQNNYVEWLFPVDRDHINLSISQLQCEIRSFTWNQFPPPRPRKWDESQKEERWKGSIRCRSVDKYVQSDWGKLHTSNEKNRWTICTAKRWFVSVRQCVTIVQRYGHASRTIVIKFCVLLKKGMVDT